MPASAGPRFVPGPALFIVGRERAKLSYFWRHAYRVPRSGPYLGCATNPDTGKPIILDDRRLTVEEFGKTKISELVEARDGKACRALHSALWQADPDKIHRMAPVEFIGRYMDEWFDYAICDEIHQLAGDTAQGNALGTLASCAGRIVGLTGTLLGGYADDVYNTLFRLEAGKMKGAGYEFGTAGCGAFNQDYGVLETITRIAPDENACSKAKTTTTVRRKPGASPLLFGEFLMQLCAFVFLEDISSELPPYEETLVSVPMDGPLMAAYKSLEHCVQPQDRTSIHTKCLNHKRSGRNWRKAGESRCSRSTPTSTTSLDGWNGFFPEKESARQCCVPVWTLPSAKLGMPVR